MISAQMITLAVLAAVVIALIWDRVRADVVALAGAAVLLMTGVVRPVEVQSAFASPAIIALASLFVIAFAMELSGLLDAAIARLVALCRRIGSTTQKCRGDRRDGDPRDPWPHRVLPIAREKRAHG